MAASDVTPTPAPEENNNAADTVAATLPPSSDNSDKTTSDVSSDNTDNNAVDNTVVNTDNSATPSATDITLSPVNVNAASATTLPVDTNNQVNAQSVDNDTRTTDATPQSKIVGISVGAVVGCIAAAGLAGMFIYKRKEKAQQDVESSSGGLDDGEHVNTRWRTQSFMAVVTGAVARLPKRSNSSASTASTSNGVGINNVFGSIRRVASNASRSLSIRSARSNNSTRSSVQSYGIAVSGPVPPIARVDGADQATYYGEPQSPSDYHHTHAY